MDITKIQIGHWYDTNDDNTIKVIDKLFDCFVVIEYSNHHHSFSLGTYPFSAIEPEEDEWREIDPEQWGFSIENPDYHPNDKNSEPYVEININHLSEKDL